jgi:phosphatidate cytidylyltransferase
MLAFVYLTRQDTAGIYVVWLILITAWGCDTCAYVVGVLIGKKKIFPVLSPKKSLEGCIGGVVGAALIGWLYGFFWVNRMAPGISTEWETAIICGIAAIISQVGDLAASGIKRDAGIKDYGKLIPGHGGVMDRFDSMIATAPVIYFLSVLMMEF